MKRIGIIGGGQLALMMGEPAKTLGLELIVQTPAITDPAVAIAQDVVLASVGDAVATNILANKSDLITFENEFVDLDALSDLEKQGVCFRPHLDALSPLLDKYHQRCYLRDLNLPVPQFFPWVNCPDLASKIEYLGFPLVVKSRRHGYDGQGTFIVDNHASFSTLVNQVDKKPVEFLIEEFVPFTKELAIVAARSVKGEIVTYPVVETQQEKQVCRRVIVPADITPDQEDQIVAIARKILTSLGVVGVFGIELFITAGGKILINEIAPRTHNSGHFSLDACKTSQFEQQLRAVVGMDLGDTSLTVPAAVMVNLLGYEESHNEYFQTREKLATIPHSHLHWYGKRESRLGRKLGHITILIEELNRELIEKIIYEVESIWYTRNSADR
ncbi:5-(carboxyamino)imidazole ribonucleotide synthase [Cylindrospermopsis raciborskii S07]|uniref:N5-carboxyaminoimidazole ribonucleotide synthase n=1 Tax=Cylindrospermopsis raciborskii CS-506_A TaxID=2585140 RepID=A0A838WRX0_9CYAN|nr:5-(carboxyamino)imidazole ribonucleotide synthase [Cylindrospermopsis raciborskii]MBA4444679.1 5-(carboxyamino)imidazole ribonucleotide synthase [Cylindrospermopsis raciborskii CS-506_C]MBA4448898.1 5-(carboxyamino)imidazole ribonucleotide synthase [Cylindrospermopsis raciborskii CS-506_D]MBA4455530.1 5-(carboxyamino)imidazole ribonucleotide synthase [Cylindrospermopsis raciborskii CS-506_B]MBA4464879.1 5-(carboxyamino)imidazole ribonucleotide synthase [Cylindrospermopsis raciborskii CS-506_